LDDGEKSKAAFTLEAAALSAINEFKYSDLKLFNPPLLEFAREEDAMKISVTLSLLACVGALIVAAPRSASSMPAAWLGHVSKAQQTDDLVQNVRRRWRRGRRYGVPRYGYYPYYYYRPSYSYIRPRHHRQYYYPYKGRYHRPHFFYRKPR
jgi:hypothetical protein